MISIRKFTNNSKYLIIFFSIITNTNCAIVFATQTDFSKLEDIGKEEYKLIQIGRNAEAIKSLEKKINNNTKNPYLYYLLGRAYGNLKQFEIGERYFKKSLRSFPNYPKVYLGYALMKGRKGELKEAVKLLDKAIEIDPKYAKAYSNRGVAKGALSDNVGAIDDFNKAILIDPLLADAYRNRGITNELIGNIKGACKDWKTASSLGQNQTKDWFNTQCQDIREIKEEENQKLVSSLIETNQRLNLELQSIKNNSSQLREFSIGTLSNNEIQRLDSEKPLKIIENKKNQTLNKPTIEKKESNKIIEPNQVLNNPLIEKKEFNKKSLNEDKFLVSDQVKILNTELQESSELKNSSKLVGELPSKISNQIPNIEQSKLERNYFSKNKNNLIALLYFFSGGLLSLIISKLITKNAKKKKVSSSKSLNKKNENIKNNLSQEFQDLNKLISKKTEILNNLLLEKEIIENKIESLKYDLNYYEIQKSNFKVYTLSKYKELFSNNLNNIEYFKFNGIANINLIDKNNNFYNLNNYKLDVNSYKFLKNS